MNHDAFFSRTAEAMQQSPIRQMGQVAANRSDLISFAPGYPGPDSFAWDDYRAIVAELLTGADAHVLQYGETRGYKPLVDRLVALTRERGIAATPEQTLVTTGSQQSLDLLARVLLDPGDVVLLELPSYTGAIAAFRNTRATLVGVRQRPDGIDLDDLDAALSRARSAGERVKLLYLIPNFQNPTGSLLSLAKRRALLEWAARADVLILEDDPYGALHFDDVASAQDTRPIKADDRDDRVIYVSSFSKTLTPGFRTAWIVAAPVLTAKVEVAKQAADICTSELDQRIVHEAIGRGVLARQVPLLRRYYQHKRTVMEGALREHLSGWVSWPTPKGGFFLWLDLPAGMNCHSLLRRSTDNGVIFVAGSAFYIDGSGTDRVRLSFSLVSPDQIVDGIRRFASAVTAEAERLNLAPPAVA